MKRSLLALLLSSSIPLFGAGDPVIQLEPELAELRLEYTKNCYQIATEKLGREPQGTVAELNKEIIDKGWGEFFATNQDITTHTLEILAPFDSSVPAKQPLIRIAQESFATAAADPQNVDLWAKEYVAFSLALLMLAAAKTIEGFKAHPDPMTRIVVNDGWHATQKQRVELAAFMSIITVRFNQRYKLMGHEKYLELRERVTSPEMMAQLAGAAAGLRSE